MENNHSDKKIRNIIQPLKTYGRGYHIITVVLGGIVFIGFLAWINQLISGLGVTGMKNSVNWGVYFTNFVFFIGISHAGTLISAILRVSHAEWRRPITRIAEAITVFALIMGGIQLLFDLGRPHRLFNVIFSGRLGSPLLWDVICISVYLLSSLFYLLLPLIPDMGLLKTDNNISGRKRKLYNFLSFDWKSTPEQKRRLEKVIGFMAVLIIPIMISVHSAVSWLLGMTVRPMWHSTIFGPYFVTGAIFSGIAVVIIAMAIIRKVYKLENYLRPIHFNYLGILLLVLSSLWFYFTFSEYLTTGYGALTEELSVFNSKVTGEFKILFWSMLAFMTTAFILLLFRKKNIIRVTTAASGFVVVGMWMERFIIIVPTLTKTYEEGYRAGIYYPTLTEWIITFAGMAGFALLFVIFTKWFPLISLWEIKEAKQAVSEGTKRMESYLPEVVEFKKQIIPDGGGK